MLKIEKNAYLLREGDDSFSCMWTACPGVLTSSSSSSTSSPQDLLTPLAFSSKKLTHSLASLNGN